MDVPAHPCQFETVPRPGRMRFGLSVDDHAAVRPQRRPFCVPPPPSRSTGSLARDYEDQLHLAASSTLLLERLQQGSKEGLTSVLVTLALCVLIGLIASTVLATSRRLVAGKDPDTGSTEATLAGLILQAPAVAPPVVPGSAGKHGADSGTHATATGARNLVMGADASAGRRRNASVQGSWLDHMEEREWTADLNSSATEEPDLETTGRNTTGTVASFERRLPR